MTSGSGNDSHKRLAISDKQLKAKGLMLYEHRTSVISMLNTKQIYLLRHGEILTGKDKRYIGQTNVPLNSKGLRQALWWKKELSQVNFEGIYCSDLARALDTTKRVANMDESHIHILPQLR